MSQMLVRYTFAAPVSMVEVEGTLHLARIAAEIIFGRERVELEATYTLDDSTRSVAIDMTGEVSRTLGLIFRGYARREFGAGEVEMARLSGPPAREGVPV